MAKKDMKEVVLEYHLLNRLTICDIFHHRTVIREAEKFDIEAGTITFLPPMWFYLQLCLTSWILSNLHTQSVLPYRLGSHAFTMDQLKLMKSTMNRNGANK